MPMFHSVILAGVYDIKNLKLKFRSESEHQYNSPWNIATNFNIDIDTTRKKFIEYFNEIYSNNDNKFMEVYGRKFFCCI